MSTLATFKVGERVRVWPRPGARVPQHPTLPGRFLAASGADVLWSPWWARRFSDGSVLVRDPTPKPAAAASPSAAAASEPASPHQSQPAAATNPASAIASNEGAAAHQAPAAPRE